jgi:hypothetical protein
MKKTAWRIIQISLLLLTVAAIAKAVFVSLDIDESYAAAEAYRLVTGDKLLFDLWEPHQFSALLPALFLFPFVKITGSAAGSIIYLRVIGILIHLAVGLFLYFTAKEKTGSKSAFLLFVFHMNFLPKWVAMPEFELIHYWCFLLIFLLLYRYEEKKNALFPLFAGVAYFFSGMSYPTMVLLYPFFLICMLLRKGKRSAAGWFTLGAAVPSGILIASILSYLPAEKVTTFVGYVFMDASHTSVSAAGKLVEYGRELLSHGIKFGKSFCPAVVITLILWLILRKKAERKFSFVTFLVISLFISVGFLSARAAFGFVFEDKNQFFFQVRYAVALFAFLLLGFKSFKENKAEVLYGMIPSVLAFGAILAITNMDINTTYAKLMPGIIAGLMLLCRRANEEKTGPVLRISAQFAAGMLLLCFFICRILLIRVNGCLPVTVKAKTVRIADGPAAGVYVPEEPGRYWNEAYAEMKSLIPEDANVLYIGAEQLFYMTFCQKAATPSVQGTTVFNEMYGKYYEVFPEKTPEIVVIDTTFGENPAYYYSPENSYITEWIEENLEISEEKTVGAYRILYASK